MEKIRSKKIIIGASYIRLYIGGMNGGTEGISRSLYHDFLKMGLPVVKFKGKHFAVSTNIDNFFGDITRKQQLDGALEGGIE